MLSTSFPTKCEACGPGRVEGPADFCASCGFGPHNLATVRSGDGDGIYAIFEVVDGLGESNEVQAIVVVFDSNYELANGIRFSAETKTLFDFQPPDISKYLSLTAIHVADLQCAESLFIGGGTKIEPAIDCTLESYESDWKAIAFAENPNEHGGPVSASGPQEGYLPRLLMIGDQKSLTTIFGKFEVIEVDWNRQTEANLKSIVTSHLEPVGTSVLVANAYIADAYLTDVTHAVHKIRNWDDDFYSWIFAACELGSTEALQILSNCTGAPGGAVRRELVKRRLGSVEVELNKSSDGELIKESNSGLLHLQAGFCADCKFEFNDLNNYCPSCGLKRN